jgi:hypothetical protein
LIDKILNFIFKWLSKHINIEEEMIKNNIEIVENPLPIEVEVEIILKDKNGKIKRKSIVDKEKIIIGKKKFIFF